MTVQAYRLYPIVALAVLAGTTLWLERISAPEEPRSSIVERGKADFIATGTRLVSFDRNGVQRYELHAERITHYPGSEVTELTRPRLTQSAEGRQLHITAEQGEALGDGEEVRLQGDVVVVRKGAAGETDSTFRSPTLTVWPDEERAVSLSPVVLTRGQSVVHASGLEADNLFGTLLLKGRVQATMPRTSRSTP